MPEEKPKKEFSFGPFIYQYKEKKDSYKKDIDPFKDLLNRLDKKQRAMKGIENKKLEKEKTQKIREQLYPGSYINTPVFKKKEKTKA